MNRKENTKPEPKFPVRPASTNKADFFYSLISYCLTNGVQFILQK